MGPPTPPGPRAPHHLKPALEKPRWVHKCFCLLLILFIAVFYWSSIRIVIMRTLADGRLLGPSTSNGHRVWIVSRAFITFVFLLQSISQI